MSAPRQYNVVLHGALWNAFNDWVAFNHYDLRSATPEGPEPVFHLRSGGLPPNLPEKDLTSREMQVLIGMSRGLTNSEIGAELFLDEDTIKTHGRRLFRKLGAHSRLTAVLIGLRRGLLPLEPGETS